MDNLAHQPLVSIAMPILNCEKTLPLAMQSVLWQTYANWELIVVDDGSTDSSLTVAQRYDDQRIKIIPGGKNLGLAARLNQSIDICRGELLARLDGDDIAYPERFARQVLFLTQNRHVDLLGTGAMVFTGNGIPLGLFPIRQTHEEICQNPSSGFYLPHPTWMGRTAWFRKHRYQESMVKAQDQELLLRAFRTSTFACLPEELLGYRLERLSLKKILGARYFFSCALAEACRRNDQYYGSLLVAITKQVAKGVIDTIAILSGLNWMVLRHRALKPNQNALSNWGNCWKRLKAPRMAEQSTER